MSAAHDREALTVAMAIAPGVYSRNRLFELFQNADVRRARTRAALIRGIVRHMGGAHGEVSGVVIERKATHVSLRYRVATVRFERHVSLSAAETACVAYLAGRAGHAVLRATEEDRHLLDAVLRRLAGGLRLDALDAVEGSAAGT